VSIFSRHRKKGSLCSLRKWGDVSLTMPHVDHVMVWLITQ